MADSDGDEFHTPPSSDTEAVDQSQEQSVAEQVQTEQSFTSHAYVEEDDEEDDIEVIADAQAAIDFKTQGNSYFKQAEYEEAIKCYSNAIKFAPRDDEADEEDGKQVNIDKKDVVETEEDTTPPPPTPSEKSIKLSMYYNNRAAAHFMLADYAAAVKDTSASLRLQPRYVKALLRRGKAREKLDSINEALEDFRGVVTLDPSNVEAKRAMQRLEPLVAARFEEQKEEMMGKLKSLGNTVLGKFGMSLDNFQAVQDPNTGGYSINFRQ